MEKTRFTPLTPGQSLYLWRQIGGKIGIYISRRRKVLHTSKPLLQVIDFVFRGWVVLLCSYRRCLLFVSSYCFVIVAMLPVSSHCVLRVVNLLVSSYSRLRVVVLSISPCSSIRRRLHKLVSGKSIFPVGMLCMGTYIVFTLAKHIMTFRSYLLLFFWEKFGELHPWKTEFVAILARKLAMSRVTMNLLISVMFSCLCIYCAAVLNLFRL